MNMSTGDLTYFSEKLVRARKEIEARIGEMKKERDYGDDTDSFEEEGNEATEFANQVELERSLDARMARIDAALEKIKDGTYGVCESCHKPIERNLLEIDPESELCQDCKRKMAS